MRSHRSIILACGVLALVACSSLAHAQPPLDVECRKTETQAECHARLKCKASEDLEQCQRRLLKCTANENLEECKRRAGTSPKQGGGQRDDADQGRDADQRAHDRDADRRARDRGATIVAKIVVTTAITGMNRLEVAASATIAAMAGRGASVANVETKVVVVVMAASWRTSSSAWASSSANPPG